MTALLSALVTLLSLATLVTPPTSAAADPPGRGDDFARLPEACYVDGQFSIKHPCQVTTYARRPYLVAWGDSHMLMYATALTTLAKQQRVNLVFLLVPGCPVSMPFPVGTDIRITCDQRNLQSLAYLKTLTRTHRAKVVIGGYWAGYRHTYQEIEKGVVYPEYNAHIARLAVERSRPMMRAVARLKVPVAFLAQAATVSQDQPLPCLLGEEPWRCDQLRRDALPDETANRRFITHKLGGAIPGSTLIDPSPLYCDDLLCHGTVDGANVFYDDYHLSDSLASRTTTYFKPFVK